MDEATTTKRDANEILILLLVIPIHSAQLKWNCFGICDDSKKINFECNHGRVMSVCSIFFCQRYQSSCDAIYLSVAKRLANRREDDDGNSEGFAKSSLTSTWPFKFNTLQLEIDCDVHFFRPLNERYILWKQSWRTDQEIILVLIEWINHRRSKRTSTYRRL